MQLIEYQWDNFVFWCLKATLTSQYSTCHPTQHLPLEAELWIKWHMSANRVTLWQSMVYSDLNRYPFGWWVEYGVWKITWENMASTHAWGATDWENGSVTDIIYGNQLIIRYSSVHVRLIRYLHVDVRWCRIYPLGSFVQVQNCERQPMDNSFAAVRSSSVPNLFCLVLAITCLVLLQFISVHIRQLSICAPQWRTSNGHVTDNTMFNRTSTTHMP